MEKEEIKKTLIDVLEQSQKSGDVQIEFDGTVEDLQERLLGQDRNSCPKHYRSATKDDKNVLSEVYTSDLVSELSRRSGVDVIEIAPYERVNLSLEGSAVVLKVID